MSRVDLAWLLMIATIAGAQEPGRDSDYRRKGSENEGDRARLIQDCAGTVRTEKMTLDEYKKYCRWVVRVAPESGSRSRSVVPEGRALVQEALADALAPLTAVQPPQIQNNRASVLAQRPGAAAGEFTVVSLTRTQGVWRVESMSDSRPGPVRRAR
jgi:hypothetical protein